MKIILTPEQITLIKERLAENLTEQEGLVQKNEDTKVNPWDFVGLSNEQYELEAVIESGFIII